MKALLVLGLFLSWGLPSYSADNKSASTETKTDAGSCKGDHCSCKEKECTCKDHKDHKHHDKCEHKAGENCSCACADKSCHSQK